MNKTLETTIRRILEKACDDGANMGATSTKQGYNKILSAFTEMLEKAIEKGYKDLDKTKSDYEYDKACANNLALDQFKQNLRTEAGIIIK